MLQRVFFVLFKFVNMAAGKRTTVNRTRSDRRLKKAAVVFSGPGPLVVPGVTRSGGAFVRAQPFSGEKKYKDTDVANVTIPNTGVVHPTLLGIDQGATEITRVGNRIRLKNVNIFFSFSIPSTATAADAEDVIRIIFFVDTQCNGLAPGVTDILKTANFLSFRNMNQADRFVILKDKVFAMNSMSANGTACVALHRHVKMSWKGDKLITYGGGGDTVSALKSTNVAVMVISASGNAQIQYKCRVKYTDV